MTASESELEKVSRHSSSSADDQPTLAAVRTAEESAAAAKDEDVRKTVTQERRDAESSIAYPTGAKMFVIVLGLSLAVLCVALDNTIIATAIPRITDDFHALSDVGWYGSAYLLTTCSFQLAWGKVYSLRNIKWSFLVAMSIFEIGSLICAVAPNSTALIVGRAIAGIGSAGIFSGGLIILAHAAPLEKRPVYTGALAGMYGIAGIVGPLLGGVFTDHVTWRWCFYINLPLGGITMASLLFFLESIPAPPHEERTWFESIAIFDPLGTVLFLPCVVTLLLALQWGGTTYAWNDGRIIALFVVFGVLAIAFAAVQVWVGDNATVPLRIARQRSILGSTFFSFGVGSVFFILVYYLPIWFQAIHGTSATQSGIDTLPLLLACVFATLFSGAVVTTMGYYTPFMYACIVFAAIGTGLLTTLTPESSTGKWVGFQILVGAGVGMGMQQSMIAAQTVLPILDIPIGTSIVMFAQMFGGSLFVSVAQNVFTNHLVEGLEGLAGINPLAVINSGATEISSLIHDPALLQLVLNAYNFAITRTFQVGLIMICLAAIPAAAVEWKSVKGKKIDPAAAAA